MNLTGKVAVVTGSGQGLGLAYASALARAGAGVVINDINAEAAAQAVKTIQASGGQAVSEVAAVGSSETADALVARALDAFGRLDIMVTNAGLLRDKVLWNMTDEDFDSVVNVHLRGTFTCARAAVRHFRTAGKAGGSSWRAHPPDSEAISARPTTRRPRPESRRWPAPGPWSAPRPG